MFLASSNWKSDRENVPSSRLDLSKTGMWGAIPLVLTSQSSGMGRTVGAVGSKPLGFEPEAIGGAFDHGSCGADFGLADRACRLDVENNSRLQIDQVVVCIGEERMSFVSAGPLCRGSAGETNFGTVSLAAPHAALSRVSRYSRTARRLAARLRQFVCSALETDLCLLASAAIRLASTANPSPPTNFSSIQRSTTVSKTCRNASLSRNRPCRFFEKVEWCPAPHHPGRACRTTDRPD